MMDRLPKRENEGSNDQLHRFPNSGEGFNGFTFERTRALL